MGKSRTHEVRDGAGREKGRETQRSKARRPVQKLEEVIWQMSSITPLVPVESRTRIEGASIYLMIVKDAKLRCATRTYFEPLACQAVMTSYHGIMVSWYHEPRNVASSSPGVIY